MRDELITYLKTQTTTLKTVGVSEELPWTKDGEPLYLKNFKKIYVARESTSQEPLINTMNGVSIVNETTTLSAYLTVDAKNPLINYDTIVDLLRGASDEISTDAKLDRTVSVEKTLDGDAQVTEFTFIFRKVIFN